jgi:hypothetical protein
MSDKRQGAEVESLRVQQRSRWDECNHDKVAREHRRWDGAVVPLHP